MCTRSSELPAAPPATRTPRAAHNARPPPLLPPERELPAPKTPPDLLRTTSVKARPSAWPPRDRRPARPSRPAHTGLPRLPRPSPVSADAGRGWAKSSHARWPPFVPVQDAPLAGTTVCEPRELRQAAKRGVRRFGYPDSRTCGNRPGLRFGGCRPCPEITASDCG